MASRGVNRVIILGNLGADPESRPTQSGGCITNISIATSEAWRDKQTGEQKENTEWHRVVMFNRLAEIARDYLRKGAKVYIEGRLQTRKWQDQNGQDRYTTEIIANELQMLDSRPDGAQAPPSAPAQDNAPQNAPQAPQAATPPADDFNEEIPF